MPEPEPPRQRLPEDAFSRSVAVQEQRKLRAGRTRSQVWSGLGFLGVIGWSIVGPTLLGVLLGVWLDKRHPGSHPWTVTLLVAGLCLGCASAWYWVVKEEHAIHRDGEDK